MNRLRFQWNTAVSTAASCTTWHRTNFTSHSTSAHMRTSTYCSLHMHSQDHTVKTHTCTLSFFFFFFFLSLTAFLSFCLCFISQLGGIITFAIKSKQRGWIEECMPDLPFSTPSAILIVVGLLFFLSSAPFNKWSGVFFKGQIYWQSSCCEGSTSPRGPVSEWKPLLSLYLHCKHSPLAGVSMKMTSCLVANLIPFAKMHGQTAQVNDIIELMSYTPLSAVHSYGQPEAWRLSASYTGYCMFDESLEGSFR